VKQEPWPARAENPRPSGRGEVNIADLPFVEQVAHLEHPLAALLEKCGGFGDDATRRRWALAHIAARTTDEDTIRQIVAECDNGDSASNDVLCPIARNPATPVDVLILLAWNKYIIVSELAAVSPRLPLDVLIRLAHEGPLGARMGVAVNPATPPDVRAALHAAHPEDESWVQGRVAAWESGEWQRHNPPA
jgi:hypothetical protein